LGKRVCSLETLQTVRDSWQVGVEVKGVKLRIKVFNLELEHIVDELILVIEREMSEVAQSVGLVLYGRMVELSVKSPAAPAEGAHSFGRFMAQ
jgi:hypothetical protein